ncbi:MAG: recombinase [Clostridia bacterium]
MEEELKKIKEENENYLNKFYKYLENKNLSKRTIEDHISNMDFYLNHYLCNYELKHAEDGFEYVNGYLNDWFIRKASWSSAATIKSNTVSIKKFYLFMLEDNKISKEDYEFFCKLLE